jgi:hypothetical protein
MIAKGAVGCKRMLAALLRTPVAEFSCTRRQCGSESPLHSMSTPATNGT